MFLQFTQKFMLRELAEDWAAGECTWELEFEVGKGKMDYFCELV